MIKTQEYDLRTVTLEELQQPIEADFALRLHTNGPVESFCGFFDTAFRGGPDSPAYQEVVLTTAPDATGATHWGQQCFHLFPRISAAAGDVIKGSIRLDRKKENHRLMQINMSWTVEGESEFAKLHEGNTRSAKWHIE